MSVQCIKGTFTEQQGQVFNSLREKIVDPIYDFMNSSIEEHTHISFEEIKKRSWPISIVPLDLTKPSKFSEPRSRDEIRQWVHEREQRFYEPFDKDKFHPDIPFYDTHFLIGKICDYLTMMLDSPRGSRDWHGEQE